MANKKVLIQELDSKDFHEIQGQEQMEEEQLPQQKKQQIISGTIKTDQNQNHKKDLLRLEKNYFDNVYNQEKHQNEKQFAISKMLNQNPQNLKKPDFSQMPKSSIKDRLNQFMPSFKKDTDDLLINMERQEQMRIDDRNQYEVEQEEGNNQNDSDNSDSEDEFETEQQQDDNHAKEIAALKKKNKEQLKNKKNKQSEQNDPSKPKMIQLDMLLGVLEQKDPNEQNQQDDNDQESDNDEMNIEQDSSSQMTQNTNNLSKVKIQEINQ